MIKQFKIFRKKKILITGFNGFKGAWLCLMLKILGANLYGISLRSNYKNNHYNLISKRLNLKEYYFDISNLDQLNKTIKTIKPDFVFHLAAQSLVFKSLNNPYQTWKSNVIGFLNVLICLNKMEKKCIAVMITSDKCYKNVEQKKGYKENDILGGDDPYSASKASAEILFSSYFSSFIKNKNKNLRICTARAGNVIGGGDWSDQRLVPDCMKKWLKSETVKIRNPDSTRPWQHVLEALNGYLYLAFSLHKSNKFNGESFNFSSDKIKNLTVINFLNLVKKQWPEISWKIIKKKKFKESGLLQLNNSKAQKKLGWKPKLNIQQTIKFIVSWYKDIYINKKDPFKVTNSQIINFLDK